MNTDNSEAMRLVEPPNIENLKKIAASDSTTAIRNGLLAAIKWIQNLDQSLKFEQAASFRNQVADLEAERDEHQATATALISLLADIRKACGDNGKRMQPELVEFIGSITADRDLLRADVIANRERDALKLAALHIHSEMRSIVQAGGSNEAIGREFRKRVILDVEDEVVKLRAEVERLRADGERLDHIEKRARCDPKMDGQHVWWPTSFSQALKGPTLRAAIDLARTTHKETE